MDQLRKQSLLEQLIYAVIWFAVFLAPILIEYYMASTNTGWAFSWLSITWMWGRIGLFFVMFLLNNYWLIPAFLLRKKYTKYAFAFLVMIGLFVSADLVYDSQLRTRMRPVREQRMEMSRENRQREPPIRQEADFRPPVPDGMPGGMPGRRRPQPQAMPGFVFPEMLRVLVLILMVGFNVAIKLLFKSIRDEGTMQELERHKLKSELEYLKYQINPHFFMNTLNNIHALVGIDPSLAQKTIIELSKMMRYVLYEANKTNILLSREIQFITNYVELMKLRYTNKVLVKVVMPDEVPEVSIPPLLYISFIENAFKHGVSYQTESSICVILQVDDNNLVFSCTNTNKGKSKEQHKGIGIDNVQKRLKLLYKNNYTLSINNNSESFDVLLIIPLL